MSDDHGHDPASMATTSAPSNRWSMRITDYEVLEIALRELCIERACSPRPNTRQFTEYARQIGAPPPRRPPGGQSLARIRSSRLVLGTPSRPPRPSVWTGWTRPASGTPSDFTAFKVGNTPGCNNVIVCVRCAPATPDPGQLPEWYRIELPLAHRALATRCSPNSAWNCPTASGSGWGLNQKRIASW